ncbi:hypothetical protein [Pseudoxanthomonas sp. 10H]|uniref:hypothetical protein n=1 Tax=Pseudoxanthomonas sp. 10H TaxID=3242729 RepID=UPI003556E98C
MDAIMRLVAVIFLFAATSDVALAYLDPVSGSLVIQGLIALVAGIVAGVKSVRRRIGVFFSSIFKRKSEG